MNWTGRSFREGNLEVKVDAVNKDKPESRTGPLVPKMRRMFRNVLQEEIPARDEYWLGSARVGIGARCGLTEPAWEMLKLV